MVTSPCQKCGEVLKHDEDTVPPSGMVVKCPKCQASVTVMSPDAVAMGMMGGGDDGILALDDNDLVEDLSDAVVPVARKVGLPDLPAPVSRKSGLPDLPAPVSRKSGLPDLPAPVSRKPGLPDLPAPVSRKSGLPDLPAPVSKRAELPDLPAPVSKRAELPNLPAPVAGVSGLPAPAGQFGTNLPAPSGGTGLPAPAGQFGTNLPAPSGVAGLPSPVGGSSIGHDDLPAPVRVGVGPDSLAPVGGTRTPGMGAGGAALDMGGLGPSGNATTLGIGATAGSMVDPLGGGLDLGGGGDPLGGGLNIGGGGDPLGGGLDLGGGGGPLGGGLDLGGGGGPLGGGLDLGGGGDPLGGGLDIGGSGDPLGGGLDLGGPGPGGGIDLGGPGGGGLDLGGPGGGGLDLGGPGGGGGLDLGGPGPGGGIDLGGPGGGIDLGGPGDGVGLDIGGPGDGVGLDLGGPGLSLDLPTAEPPSGGQGVVTFGQSGAPKKKPAPVSERFKKKPKHDAELQLDLDDAPMDGPALKRSPDAIKVKKKTRRASKQKQGFGKKQKMMAGAVGLVLVAGAGVYGVTEFMGKKAKGEEVSNMGKGAAVEIASNKVGHWDRAIASATKMQAADPKNVEAMALLAEAHYAAAMDNGTGATEHAQAGAAAVVSMRRLKGTSPHVSLAEGLHSLSAKQFEDAIRHLTAGATENKTSAPARLYLAWAYAAKHDHSKAVDSYDVALQIMPDNISAHYGKAGSLVYLGKHKEANESFLAAIKAYRKLTKGNHIGSQVGIAQIVDVENFGDRENRYLEILGAENIGKQDSRIVARAWVLAAEEARRAGRLAVAEERLSHAIKLDEGSMEAVVGQAAVAYSKGDIEEAAAKLNAVLALAPGHLQAALLFIEVSIAQGDNGKAGDKLADLLALDPKIEYRPILSRMELLRGRILATDKSSTDDAVAAYREAFELAEDGGVESSLELAEFYNRIDRPEDAVATLAPLQKKAQKDPALAVILGVAYLGSKDADQAITLFKLALSQQPGDAEARFQLGRSLAMADRADEAVTELQRGYEDSEYREDIGLELADIYRRMERFDDAEELYKKILSGENPSRNARASAGTYFARVGNYEEASAIGVQLLEEDPKDPAGLFLSGETHFQAGEYQEARDQFKKASKLEPLPQYQDGLGRAYEKLLDMTKSARAYELAIKGDPKYIQPRLGLANVHFARKEYSIVIDELKPALEIDPRHVQIHYQIGRSHLEMRETDLAIAALQKGVAVDANHGLSHMAIGLAYDAKGDPKTAAISYRRATKTTGNAEADWLPEAYRLLGYAIRGYDGPKPEQRDAFQNYMDRVEIEDDQSKEVKKLLIPLSRH